MDLQRRLLVLILMLSTVSATMATPIDTTWDLLHAVESCNGQWFLDLLSESLRIQIETRFEQLQDLAETEPELIEIFIRNVDLIITVTDLQYMTAADFISMIFESMNLPPLGNIVSEDVSMNGRNAVVVFRWMSGYSLSLQMIWEESSWKVNGSTILERIF